MDLKKLNEDAVALVTGAASGLGAAAARRLHAHGAAVVLLDLPGSSGAELAAELNHLRESSAVFAPADVSSAEQVQAAVDQAAALGSLRILVNAAGIDATGTVLESGEERLTLARFTKVVQVNLIGSFNVLQLAAEAMSANEPVDDGFGGAERGVIINTSSCLAYDGQSGTAGYSASKGGLVAMNLPIARELSSSFIRIVDIAPGIFRTPMLDGVPKSDMEALTSQVPFPKREGDPAEYASLVEHIVANAMFNGTSIRLDAALRLAGSISQ